MRTLALRPALQAALRSALRSAHRGIASRRWVSSNAGSAPTTPKNSAATIADIFDAEGTWSLSSLLPREGAGTEYALPISLAHLSEFAALPIVDARAIEKDVRQIFALAAHLDSVPVDVNAPQNLARDVVITQEDLDAADAEDERARASPDVDAPRETALSQAELLRLVPQRFKRDPYILGN